MANFDRNFLVPYLENICTLQLLKRKIENKYYNAASAKRNNEQVLSSTLTLPQKPVLEKTSSCLSVFLLIFGIFAIFWMILGLATISNLAEDMGGGLVFIIFGGIICIIVSLVMTGSAKERNREATENYESTVAKMRSKYENAITTAKSKECQLIESAKYWKNELDKISSVIDCAYDVNIIPRHYRDIYTAVYLYDWFSTGMSTDLDHALSMFVLEEIKAKLDIIISKLDDVLINQSHIISNQERAIAQQEADNKRLMNKLNDMQATEEERNCYLNMIESNTRATAYFAAADYVRKL